MVRDVPGKILESFKSKVKVFPAATELWTSESAPKG